MEASGQIVDSLKVELIGFAHVVMGCEERKRKADS